MAIKETIDHAKSYWMEGHGPDSDIVISSRARLARNLSDIPFPHLFSENDANKVLSAVQLALKEAKEIGNYDFTLIEELSPIERDILVQKHLISPQHTTGNLNAVVIRDDEALSIMVNEEDHLRIQCLLPGFQLEEAWNLASQVEDSLEKTLDIAFCEKRGYLTACPTNVGTGLRVSTMLHLPALVLTNQVGRVLNALPQLGVVVRGLYGEGTEAAGNIFQISNQVTLGVNESEIINKLSGVVKQITKQERETRVKLSEESNPQLTDIIGRSLGILKFAHIVSSQETLKLLSDLRLGLSLGILKGAEQSLINELMVLTRPAFLQKLNGGALNPLDRDIYRANVLRQRLNAITM